MSLYLCLSLGLDILILVAAFVLYETHFLGTSRMELRNDGLLVLVVIGLELEWLCRWLRMKDITCRLGNSGVALRVECCLRQKWSWHVSQPAAPGRQHLDAKLQGAPASIQLPASLRNTTN